MFNYTSLRCSSIARDSRTRKTNFVFARLYLFSSITKCTNFSNWFQSTTAVDKPQQKYCNSIKFVFHFKINFIVGFVLRCELLLLLRDSNAWKYIKWVHYCSAWQACFWHSQKPHNWTINNWAEPRPLLKARCFSSAVYKTETFKERLTQFRTEFNKSSRDNSRGGCAPRCDLRYHNFQFERINGPILPVRMKLNK